MRGGIGIASGAMYPDALAGGAATVSEPTVAAARSTLGSAIYDIDTFGRSVQLPAAGGIGLASAWMQPAGADLAETDS